MMRRALVLLPPFLWLVVLVAAPVAILAGIALSQGAPGVPPFLPPVSLAEGWQDRVDLYQLLPLLVHAELFGGGYGASAERAARRYVSL